MSDPICLASITPSSPQWLWRPYLPLGMLTTLEGDPGVGKSWLTLWMAARLSQGLPLHPFSSEKKEEPQRSLFIACEDPLDMVVRPRLDLLGANPEHIFFKPDLFTLDKEGLRNLSANIEHLQPSLVVIDPVTAVLGAGTDFYRANEVRSILRPLSNLMTIHKCAGLLVRHWVKASGGKAFGKGLGSVDFQAIARSMLSVIRYNETVILSHSKCNISDEGPSLAYKVNGGLEWIGESALSVDQILEQGDGGGRGDRGSKRRTEMATFLREQLAGGPRRAIELYALARERRWKWEEVKVVKEEIGVIHWEAETGTGEWIWSLPDSNA